MKLRGKRLNLVDGGTCHIPSGQIIPVYDLADRLEFVDSYIERYFQRLTQRDFVMDNIHEYAFHAWSSGAVE